MILEGIRVANINSFITYYVPGSVLNITKISFNPKTDLSISLSMNRETQVQRSYKFKVKTEVN